MHQHRSPQPRPGRGGGGFVRGLALSLAFAGFVLGGAACGDDDDEGTPTRPGGNTTAAAITARSLLPKLDDLGFPMTESGVDPGNPRFDTAVALYKGKEPQQQVQVRIYVLPTEEAATMQFNAFAVALRNPPKEFLGVEAKFVDASSPPVGDARKAYRTETPDGSGYTAYTDVYRKGRTVVLTQVVDRVVDGAPLRQQVAERIVTGAP